MSIQITSLVMPESPAARPSLPDIPDGLAGKLASRPVSLIDPEFDNEWTRRTLSEAAQFVTVRPTWRSQERREHSSLEAAHAYALDLRRARTIKKDPKRARDRRGETKIYAVTAGGRAALLALV